MHYLTETNNMMVAEKEGKIIKVEKLKKNVHYHKLMLELNLSMRMME